MIPEGVRAVSRERPAVPQTRSAGDRDTASASTRLAASFPSWPSGSPPILPVQHQCTCIPGAKPTSGDSRSPSSRRLRSFGRCNLSVLSSSGGSHHGMDVAASSQTARISCGGVRSRS